MRYSPYDDGHDTPRRCDHQQPPKNATKDERCAVLLFLFLVAFSLSTRHGEKGISAIHRNRTIKIENSFVHCGHVLCLKTTERGSDDFLFLQSDDAPNVEPQRPLEPVDSGAWCFSNAIPVIAPVNSSGSMRRVARRPSRGLFDDAPKRADSVSAVTTLTAGLERRSLPC